MTEWISVDERLPKELSWVLVYEDGAMACRGYSPIRGFEDWNNELAPNVSTEFITHWMELPDPPSITADAAAGDGVVMTTQQQYERGDIVSVTGQIEAGYVNKERPDDIHAKRNYRVWQKWRLPYNASHAPDYDVVMLLGWTYKLEGPVWKEVVTRDFEGDYDYEPGGIDIKRTIKVWVVMPVSNNNRYRKTYFVTEDQIEGVVST